MREEKSKSGKVKISNKALFIGIVAIVLVAAAIGATANNNTEASDKVNAPDVPHKINYQGYLTDAAGNQITGDRDMTFKIYDSPTGGTPLWSETQNSVHVEKGLFNVILGSVNPIPSDVFPSGGSRWLETEIEGQTLTPRKEIVSVAYAFKAGTAAPPCWDCVPTPTPGITWLRTPNHKVGIGTTNPNVKLHVLDNLTDSHHPSILIEKTSTPTRSPRLGMVDTNPTLGTVNVKTAPVWFIDNYLDRFRIYRQPNIATIGPPDQCLLIDNQSRVGIGSDPSPHEKLTVKSGFVNTIKTYSSQGDGGVIIGTALIERGEGRIFGHNPTYDPTDDRADNMSKLFINPWGWHTILNSYMGNVGIGTTTPHAKLEVVGNILQDKYGDDPWAANHVIRKARGNAPSPGVVQQDDDVAWISGQGYDGSQNISAAGILMEVDGDPGDNDMPGRIVFQTTKDDTKDLKGRMVIKNDGNVGIGTMEPGEKLSVAGTIEAMNGGFKFPDGTIQTTAMPPHRGTRHHWGRDLRLETKHYKDATIYEDGTSTGLDDGTVEVLLPDEPYAPVTMACVHIKKWKFDNDGRMWRGEKIYFHWSTFISDDLGNWLSIVIHPREEYIAELSPAHSAVIRFCDGSAGDGEIVIDLDVWLAYELP